MISDTKVTTAMARCIQTRTKTASAGWPRYQIAASGTRSTTVTSTAARRKTHFGCDEMRATIGHPTHAITTPMTVNLE